MTNVELSNRLKSTESIVQNRVAKLESTGIISGYRAEIDLSRLGMELFKAQLFLKDYSAEAESPLTEYCHSHPNITYYIQQMGRSRLEIECEVENYGEYNKVIQDLRGRFPKLIKNVETTLISRDIYKWIDL